MTDAPATYRVTQSNLIGLLVAIVALAAVGFWVASLDEAGAAAYVAWAVVAVIAVVAALLSRLTVVVGKGQVLAEFGAGWPRRRYRLTEVRDAVQVRNRWWQGWGVRKVRGGWMYNVWGLDAVELRLAGGKVFRIGTDEPEALVAALDAERARVDRPSSADPADA